MRYSLTDLKLLVAIADSGSVSGGAATCFLAPSSASMRIKRLEESLGAQLLLRQARGVVLTPAGKVIVKHVRRCLTELEEMHAELAPYAHGIKAQVRLLANSSAVASFLPSDLQLFLREQPEVRIVMHERVSHQIIEALSEGSADIGVVNWAGEHPGLLFYPYHEDSLMVAVAPDHPLAAQDKVSFLECLEYPFVMLQAGSAIYTFLTRQAASLGHTPDIRIQVSSFSSVVAMVGAGTGLSIVPYSALQSANCENVRILPLDEPWARRSLRVCVRNDGEVRLPYVAKLIEHLRKQGDRPSAA